MYSHISHELSEELREKSVCQICQEPIWEHRWLSPRHREIKQFICHFCYTQMKEGVSRPVVKVQENLVVCDGCGKVSGEAKKINSEWMCQDCRAV